MTVPLWVWIVSLVVTLGVLAFDVWWAMRNPHVPSRKETTGFLTVYVSAAASAVRAVPAAGRPPPAPR